MSLPAALDVLVSFVRHQRSLLAALRGAYPEGRLDPILVTPRTGSIHDADARWEYRFHGEGVQFLRADGLIVDVHQNIDDADAIDAWRLLVFAESHGIDQLTEAGGTVNVTEPELESLLDRLVSSGVLERQDRSAGRIFHLRQVVFGGRRSDVV